MPSSFVFLGIIHAGDVSEDTYGEQAIPMLTLQGETPGK